MGVRGRAARARRPAPAVATAMSGWMSASAPRSRSPTTISTSRRSCADGSAAWAARPRPAPGEVLPLRYRSPPADNPAMRHLRYAWHHAAFAVCFAWLALYELRAVFAGTLDVGPFTSRFAHDVVLLVASALILVRAASAPKERLPWLLIGLGVLAWSLGEVYYTVVLW